VPSERLFSTAGQTISKLRARLSSTTADHLLFINSNMKHYSDFNEMSQKRPGFQFDEEYEGTSVDRQLVPIAQLTSAATSGQSQQPQPSTSAGVVSGTAGLRLPYLPQSLETLLTVSEDSDEE